MFTTGQFGYDSRATTPWLPKPWSALFSTSSDRKNWVTIMRRVLQRRVLAVLALLILATVVFKFFAAPFFLDVLEDTGKGGSRHEQNIKETQAGIIDLQIQPDTSLPGRCRSIRYVLLIDTTFVRRKICNGSRPLASSPPPCVGLPR